MRPAETPVGTFEPQLVRCRELLNLSALVTRGPKDFSNCLSYKRLGWGTIGLIGVDQIVSASDSFTEFARVAEPRLRLALGAAFGFDLAQEATAEALAFAWEHWDRVTAASNPIGFVFGVGRNRARRAVSRLRIPYLPPVLASEIPWVEPGLPRALGLLSVRQREVVMLLHCFQWTLGEVSEMLGLAKGTVQIHERRGLARLRKGLGVEL